MASIAQQLPQKHPAFQHPRNNKKSRKEVLQKVRWGMKEKAVCSAQVLAVWERPLVCPRRHRFIRHARIALCLLCFISVYNEVLQSTSTCSAVPNPTQIFSTVTGVQAQQPQQQKIRVPKHTVTWLTVMVLKECAWIIKDRWSSGKGQQGPTSGYFSVLKSRIYGTS